MRHGVIRRESLSAAIELRRRFPGIDDNAKARTHARTIAGFGDPTHQNGKVPQARFLGR
jgi:hypothetical protein